MSEEVRVHVFQRATDSRAVTDFYHSVSEKLSTVPGMLGNDLLRSVGDPAAFVVSSRWRSLAAFQTWEATAEHRIATAPLRPYRDHEMPIPFAIYSVVASY